MGEVSAKTRRIVYERDGYACVSQGVLPRRCGGGLTIGHIIGRGSGGGDQYDTPGWLITQCWQHNTTIEDDAQTRTAALLAGHKIPRNSISLIPPEPTVKYPDGQWWLLHDDGTRTLAEAEHHWLKPLFDANEQAAQDQRERTPPYGWRDPVDDRR